MRSVLNMKDVPEAQKTSILCIVERCLSVEALQNVAVAMREYRVSRQGIMAFEEFSERRDWTELDQVAAFGRFTRTAAQLNLAIEHFSRYPLIYMHMLDSLGNDFDDLVTELSNNDFASERFLAILQQHLGDSANPYKFNSHPQLAYDAYLLVERPGATDAQRRDAKTTLRTRVKVGKNLAALRRTFGPAVYLFLMGWTWRSK